MRFKSSTEGTRDPNKKTGVAPVLTNREVMNNIWGRLFQIQGGIILKELRENPY